MSTRDLHASLEALSQAHRGPHPPPDQLLGYHLGELDSETNDTVEEHLALCTECARNVLDMAAFLDGGTDEACPENPIQDSGECLEEDTEATTDATGGGADPALRFSRPRVNPRALPFYRRANLAWAAALFFGIVSLGLLGRLLSLPAVEAPTPRTQIALYDLGGLQRGGETPWIRFDASTPEAVLVLPAPTLGPGVTYGLVLETPEGELLWRDSALERTAAGLLTLAIPRGFLPAGRYILRLEPLTSADGQTGTPLQFELLIETD